MKSLIAALLILHSAVAAAGDNFSGADADFIRAAEQQREISAIYWSGKPLPGSWYSSCPVSWVQNYPLSGQTNFSFEGGDVFGWDMTVRGPRQDVIRNVIPHEVDHTVRASLVRHPIQRWLDEGCSSIWESPTERAKLYQAAKLSTEWASVGTLELMEYPENNAQTWQVYGFGLTMVEVLLQRGPPQTLLAFSQDNRRIAEKLPDYYGLTSDQLMQEWRVHVDRCSPSNCYVPYPKRYPQVRNLPVLEVWTKRGCEGCYYFKQQLNNDPNFRNQLTSRFVIIFRPYNLFTQMEFEMRRLPGAFPVFVTPGQVPLAGFDHKDPAKLLRDLGVVGAVPKTDAVPSKDDVLPDLIPPANEPPPEPAAPYIRTDPPRASSPPAEPVTVPSTPTPDQPTQTVPVPVVTTPPSPSIGRKIGSVFRNMVETSLPIAGLVLTALGVATPIGGGVGAAYLLSKLGIAGVTKAGAAIAAWRGKSAVRAAEVAAKTALQLRNARLAKQQADQPVVQQPTTSVAVQSQTDPVVQTGGQADSPAAPFPRQLDEVRELLAVAARGEGRVPLLDAFRGMHTEDTIQNLLAQPNVSPETRATLQQILIDVNQKVAEIAPPTTSY